MLGFIVRRVLEFIPVVLAIITMTFFLVRLAPGGPFDSDKRVSPQALKQLEAHYKLDQPGSRGRGRLRSLNHVRS